MRCRSPAPAVRSLVTAVAPGAVALVLGMASLNGQPSPDSGTPGVFELIHQALPTPGLLNHETETAMIKAAGNITGSSHALAKALRDPHLGASAELSAGGRLPGWVVLPSMQLGNENGNGTVGVTAELPGKLSNLGSYQVELKPSGGEPTLKATFRGPLVAGGSVLEGVKVYQQYSVEFQYRNN